MTIIVLLLTLRVGREIPEDLAVKTDRDNEFPKHMWKKLGEAGYMMSSLVAIDCG